MARPSAVELIRLLDLGPENHPEGGLLVETWRSSLRLSDDSVFRSSASGGTPGKPAGTATLAMMTDHADSFSAIHRLPTDEIWHFYLGDPLGLLMLRPDGGVDRQVLGQDVLAGEKLQLVVPANTWMGGRLLAGGEYALFGNTMAPGFTLGDYEAGSGSLTEVYPEVADEIRSLLRPPRR